MILSVWAVALRMSEHPGRPKTLFDRSDVLTAAWTELSTTGEIRDPVWHHLVEGYLDLDQMRDMREMPREQRVQIIDAALRMLATARRDADERRSFLAGYFTSLLAPGTLDHADILAPVAPLLPTAYLWYGLCAGVNVRGDALPVGNLLARRIVRDLTIPDRLVDRPRCDVAIEELAMHGPNEQLMRLTAKGGRVDIDILPGVTIAVRWPPHGIKSEDELRRVRDMEVQHLLMEMDETTTRWRDLTDRLRDVMRLHDSNSKPPARRKGSGKS
jgi:hypothetical protein